MMRLMVSDERTIMTLNDLSSAVRDETANWLGCLCVSVSVLI